MIERFGDDELEGWSALQFIETSSITLHADEVFGRCFVDVFSCRPFDPDVAAAIAVAYFGGRRGAGAAAMIELVVVLGLAAGADRRRSTRFPTSATRSAARRARTAARG